MVTDQRNYGDGGSASGMEMGNSSQVSTWGDLLTGNQYLISYVNYSSHPFSWKRTTFSSTLVRNWRFLCYSTIL
jgi:hypothetical protein